jgi:hypothetical protein
LRPEKYAGLDVLENRVLNSGAPLEPAARPDIRWRIGTRHSMPCLILKIWTPDRQAGTALNTALIRRHD